MKLPLIVSVPHAGTKTPIELQSLSCVDGEEVIRDGDEQAAEIYLPLGEHVAHLVTTGIARAFVDLNRAEDDFRKDGVIKTHTCWDVPIYRRAPRAETVASVLARHYHPYHERLRELASDGYVRAGVDCHTMAAFGPPVGPDAGRERPAACVSDADGSTCEPAWTRELAAQLEAALGGEVWINDPFRGGYITRAHAAELPWLQLEVSRGPFLTVVAKRKAILDALTAWCTEIFGQRWGRIP